MPQCTGGDSMVQTVANYTPLTPLSFLVRSAYVFPDKTAVVYKQYFGHFLSERG